MCEQLTQGRYLAAARPGVELATSRVASQRLNHYTTRPHAFNTVQVIHRTFNDVINYHTSKYFWWSLYIFTSWVQSKSTSTCEFSENTTVLAKLHASQWAASQPIGITIVLQGCGVRVEVPSSPGFGPESETCFWRTLRLRVRIGLLIDRTLSLVCMLVRGFG